MGLNYDRIHEDGPAVPQRMLTGNFIFFRRKRR
jgi:hypothetical protein